MSSESENAAQNWPIPPIGSPCWIEIMSVEPPKLKKFYEALFPAWEFKPGTEDHKEEDVVMFMFKEPKGLGGGIVKYPKEHQRTGEQPAGFGFTVYCYVEDLEATEKQVHELGGTTVMGKTKEGKHGYFMNFKDPEGNRFAAYTMAKSETGIQGGC